MRHLLAVANHWGVVINPLLGNDFPMVETRRVAFQMPLADHGRLIARLPEQLGKSALRTVEPVARVVVKAVNVAVSAGNNAGAGRAAERIVHQAMIKPHPLARQPVNVRRLNQMPGIAIRANRLPGMVVRHDEQDVRPCCRDKTNRNRHAQSQHHQHRQIFHPKGGPAVFAFHGHCSRKITIGPASPNTQYWACPT